MKIKKHIRKLGEDQSGIASMVIVILIMTLLTLVVLAMTQNANREQRQALDRQLSSQAFYAAESGVSDAKDFVVNPPPEVVSLDNEKLDCNGIHGAEDGNQFPGKEAQVGEFENTKYTCVLYDRTPETLRYSNIEVGKSTILPIQDIGGIPVESLTFNWTKEDGGTNFGGCPGTGTDLPRQLASDCEAGLLRIELVDPSSTSRPELIENTFVAYVRPSTSGTGSFGYPDASGSVSKQGAVANGTCDSNGCRLTINSIGKEKLYLNMRSMYKSNQVTITGQKVEGGGAVEFRNAQMEVDSTGQAGDILRRVQEMIDLSGINSGFIPWFVLQTSSDVCKQLEVRPDRVDDNC
ncbi:MAG TPA: pilus assembly PilX N-terminal domain-containing protein [Candidatus Saccharimonadales bacterium]|nr:pilus assembly PilX N-terminal domain-containing protein [Candidatus Saccharimonadales bacterium]